MEFLTISISSIAKNKNDSRQSMQVYNVHVKATIVVFNTASLLLAKLNYSAFAFVYSGHIRNLLTNLAHKAILTQLVSITKLR